MNTPFGKSSSTPVNDSSEDDGEGLETSQILNLSESGKKNSNNNPENSLLQTQKKRRKTSEVWQYFLLQPTKNEKNEQIASCKYCGHQIKYISQNGTGGLRAHAIRCSAIRDLSAGLDDVHSIILEESKKLQTITNSSHKKRILHENNNHNNNVNINGGSNNYPGSLLFDDKFFSNPLTLSKFKISITEMILLENLPYHFPNSNGFKQFLRTLIQTTTPPHLTSSLPSSLEFDFLPTINDIESEISLMYTNLLIRLHNIIEQEIILPNIRISIIIRLYATSNPSYSVMMVEIQYINNDWELRRFLLDVLYIETEQEEEQPQQHHEGGVRGGGVRRRVINVDKVVKELIQCLQEYKLNHRFFNILFDKDCIDNHIDIEFWKIIKEKTSSNSNHNNSNNKYLYDVMHDMHIYTYPYIVNQIMNELIHLLQPLLNEMKNIIQLSNLHLDIKECLHNNDNWSSIIEVLHYFITHHNHFGSSSTISPSSLSFINQNMKLLEATDKLFLAISYSIDGLTRSHMITSHLLFSNICDVNVELESFFKVYHSYYSSNEQIEMTNKISKSFRDAFEPLLPTLAIGLILDPSCKAEFINETIDAINAEKYINNLHHRFKEEYHGNVRSYIPTSNSSSSVNLGGSGDSNLNTPTIPSVKGDWTHDSRESFLKRRKIVHESSSTSSNDLESYLKEPLQIVNSTAVLQWWKTNGGRFPAVAMMARDFLACPSSASSAQEVYYQGIQKLSDSFGSLPFNSMKRALLCKDWIRTISNHA